jgi:hypothetical protein
MPCSISRTAVNTLRLTHHDLPHHNVSASLTAVVTAFGILNHSTGIIESTSRSYYALSFLFCGKVFGRPRAV